MSAVVDALNAKVRSLSVPVAFRGEDVQTHEANENDNRCKR